jgi:hypothetical protein
VGPRCSCSVFKSVRDGRCAKAGYYSEPWARSGFPRCGPDGRFHGLHARVLPRVLSSCEDDLIRHQELSCQHAFSCSVVALWAVLTQRIRRLCFCRHQLPIGQRQQVRLNHRFLILEQLELWGVGEIPLRLSPKVTRQQKRHMAVCVGLEEGTRRWVQVIEPNRFVVVGPPTCSCQVVVSSAALTLNRCRNVLDRNEGFVCAFSAIED